MKAKSIYLIVSNYAQIEQYAFFTFYNLTVGEIISMYPEIDFIKPVDNLETYTGVVQELVPAIVDNILYNMGLGDKYKSEFLRKLRLYYISLWKKRHTVFKRIKRSVV